MGTLAIFKKEMRAYFASPIAYAVFSIFVAIGGFFFYVILINFSFFSFQASMNPGLTSGLNVTDGILHPFFGNISVLVLFLMPLLTMRLFAEERRHGTLELLLTYPLRDGEILLGKFMAATTLYTVLLSTTTLYLLLLALWSEPELYPIVTGYLGLLLLGMAFLSLGLLFSSLTENQIVAAAFAFAASLLLWIIRWAASLAEGDWAVLLRHLSIVEHFTSFARGVLELKDVAYFVCMTSFFLFATLKSLEIRRWKG
ncbi:MAG TPA: ABC transporter permease subunit [Candidatus Methylomirabilis sp.]|nr:ABC transporter permease subunit [Candidatus Methylomirabilis sp.]